MNNLVYEPIQYQVSSTLLNQFCAAVNRMDCAINSLQVLQQLDPETSDIMREFVEHRGLTPDEYVCILNILGGHSHNINPPKYRFQSYGKDAFLRIVRHVGSLHAMVVYIARTDSTAHITIFSRDYDDAVRVIDPQLHPQSSQVRLHDQHIPTLDDYMASEPNATVFAIVEKYTGTKQQISQNEISAFMRYTGDDDKARFLKSQLRGLNASNCWLYATLLKRYIDMVKQNYVPFTDVFDEKDVDEILKILDPTQCTGNTYTSIIPWLKKARKQRVYVNKFIRLGPNQKLRRLKHELSTMISTDCVLYAKMLNTYIQQTQQTGPNYAPFIATFTENDLTTIMTNLHHFSCPGNTYTSVIPWIQQAYNARAMDPMDVDSSTNDNDMKLDV